MRALDAVSSSASRSNMPGLLGVVQKAPVRDVAPVFQALHAPSEHFQSEGQIAFDRRWGVGRVHLGHLQPLPQLTASGSVRALLHGDLYNEASSASNFKRRAFHHPAQAWGRFSLPFTSTMAAISFRCCGGRSVRWSSMNHARDCYSSPTASGSYGLYWYDGPQGFLFAPSVECPPACC